MLNFRNSRSVRAPTDRRMQHRLFMMVVLLAFVIWTAVEARDPRHYTWFWASGGNGSAAGSDVDTRLRREPSATEDIFVSSNPVSPTSEGAQGTDGPLTAGELDAICDDEPFRAEERPAWFKLIRQLQSKSDAELASESIGPVTFIQLYRQPKEYRAELVTLRGTVRRCERLPAPENDLGIEDYYRTWLFPADNPSNPIVVYTLTLPDAFPVGRTLEEDVELEGYSFKRWPYAAVDTVRTAPVVLTRSLRWVPPAPSPSLPPVSPGTVAALAAVLAAGTVIVVWRVTRSEARPAAEPIELGHVAASNSSQDTKRHLRLLTDREPGSE